MQYPLYLQIIEMETFYCCLISKKNPNKTLIAGEYPFFILNRLKDIVIYNCSLKIIHLVWLWLFLSILTSVISGIQKMLNSINVFCLSKVSITLGGVCCTCNQFQALCWNLLEPMNLKHKLLISSIFNTENWVASKSWLVIFLPSISVWFVLWRLYCNLKIFLPSI